MKDLSYKVALKHLISKSIEENKKALLNILKDIKEKKINDKKEFKAILQGLTISDLDLIKVIQNEIDNEKSILEFILYLGDGPLGIGYIHNSWFARNLSDKDVAKRIPKNYWNMLRDQKWIKEQTV